LAYAGQGSEGRYVYIDLWVVSPGKDYDLRVSTDKNTYRGSYLLELPQVVSDGKGGWTLTTTGQSMVMSSARVGFLASTAEADQATLDAYQESAAYDKAYEVLLGVYQEAGEAAPEGVDTTFTIYEPNGTLHAGEDDGSYLVTTPLGVQEGGTVAPTRLDADRLAVQTTSFWDASAQAGETALAQRFQAAIQNKTFSSARAAQTYFYDTYLGGQVCNLLSTGTFFADTGLLYSATGTDGKATAAELSALGTGGAAEGAVIVHLTKNVPQRLRMFVWLEGADGDCVSGSSGYVDPSQIALGIELAGSSEG
jgi:hypothetical protein